MKFLLPLLFVMPALLFAQTTTTVQVERGGKTALAKTINIAQTEDWDPLLLTIKEQPKPASDYGNKKELLTQMRKQRQSNPVVKKNEADEALTPAPILLNNFTANNSQSTPNDNHIAISDAGKIVSVVNSNLRIYDETGNVLLSKSLSSFANSLGVLQNISDPRALYDPETDRFIVMFFAGVTSTSSKIIVAFSQNNDPTTTWNFYSLNGNYLNDTTWSDYPIVSISHNDFFMTFNHLKDNSDWKTGFRYSAIWQIDKAKGYAGDSLEYNFWHHIGHNGKPVWSVCTVQGGDGPSGPESYFLSVRPGDLTNDTVFLFTISNSYQSGNAQFSSKQLKSNLSYGLPPNALQKDGQYLATNDARVLSAFVQNNRIQYVQNCIEPLNVTSAVYLGQIENPSSASPVVTAQLISNSAIDFGYPSIAYIGNNQFDNRAIITCSYSPADTFPGTVAFYRDANGNISDMLVVKQGEDAEDVLGDTIERWGDYTGIQRKYNEPNVAWLAGSYVYPSQAYRTWIAKVANPDSAVVSAVTEVKKETPVKVFPNPATEKFSVELELPKDNFTQFALYDANGKQVRVLLEDNFKAGTGVFSFNTSHLSHGVYFLKILNKNTLLRTERVVITR
ncbi:MAG TPA: T9SS type A sorting domain-containing protein [Chitinophagales bacterium]|nr:T9SS type A sorting domain-containing protein [Chitinophagales bacterium]